MRSKAGEGEGQHLGGGRVPGGGAVVKNMPAMQQTQRHRFDPWVGEIPWRRTWQPTPVFLPGKSHGQRSLLGYSPCGHKESDTAEHMHARMHVHVRAYIHTLTHSQGTSGIT